jgi:hypothetical protein
VATAKQRSGARGHASDRAALSTMHWRERVQGFARHERGGACFTQSTTELLDTETVSNLVQFALAGDTEPPEIREGNGLDLGWVE